MIRFQSELFGNSGLFQNTVGRVAGFDAGIYRKMSVCFWAEPDLMIAFAWPDRDTLMFTEGSLHVRSIVGHQAGRRRVRSAWRRIRTGP